MLLALEGPRKDSAEKALGKSKLSDPTYRAPSGKESPLDLPLPAGGSCEQPSGTASREPALQGLERIQEAATEGDKLAQVDKG